MIQINRLALLLTLSSIVMFTMPLSGQQGLELGGWLGTSFYFGDLNTRFSLTHPGPAGGLIGRYNFNSRLCLKASANYGFLRADDAWSENAFERSRNLNFRTHLGDFTGQFEFNFFPYIHGSRDQWFTPYIFAGFSVFSWSPYAVYDGTKTPPLRALGTEGQFPGEEYAIVDRAMTYGGGLKMDISPEWSLNFEISFRKLFTDYLDDVSGYYPDMNELRANRPGFAQIAVLASDPSIPDVEGNRFGFKGKQRGDGSNRDSFSFFSIGLVYYIGNLKCPEISR